MVDPAAEKRELRRRMRAARTEQTARPGDAAGAAICDNFLAHLHGAADRVISAYWPMPGEADVRPLLQAVFELGAVCALPVMAGKREPLLFRRWSPGDALIENAHGIHEPSPSEELVVPDLVLVPLLAFDRDGWRLGQGGGYYDRSLAALRADAEREARAVPLAVGVAFAAQEVDSVPHDSFDQRLDWVVTEQAARQFS